MAVGKGEAEGRNTDRIGEFIKAVAMNLREMLV